MLTQQYKEGTISVRQFRSFHPCQKEFYILLYLFYDMFALM